MHELYTAIIKVENLKDKEVHYKELCIIAQSLDEARKRAENSCLDDNSSTDEFVFTVVSVGL